SNAWTTKVMMKRPVTSTAASDARNSTVVSFGFSSAAFFSAMSSFLATFALSTVLNPRATYSVYQPQRPVPAGVLKQMGEGIGEPVSPSAWRFIVQRLHRPVDQQRPADDVFPRHESPIAAVLAVIAVVTHHKIAALRNDELAILDQLAHLQPPLAFHAVNHRHIGAGKIIPEQIARRLDEPHVRFNQRFAVDVDRLVHHTQAFSGHADHPLYEMLLGIHGIVKHNDIAARDSLVRHQVVAQSLPAIAKLIHQQVVA